MVVKIDHGPHVNTIPLSRYRQLFPNHLSKSRYPKVKSLMPTNHTWMSHDGLPKPFLGHFILDVAHTKEPRMYPVRFYVFEDATNPPNLLSYATSERLGIVQFQVPNLAATHSLDQLAVSTPGGKKKTAKKVTFQDPISETEGSHTCSNPQDNRRGKRKTTVLCKGEEALTSGHSKTTRASKEVKVGSINHSNTISLPKGIFNHSHTIPSPQAPNSPASKTIRCHTLAIPPFPALPSQFSATQKCSQPR